MERWQGALAHVGVVAAAGRRPGPGAESLIVIVLGIDPGLANTGYGIVRALGGRLLALDGGVIETPARTRSELRLVSIHDRLGELIDEHGCEAMALEDLYFGQNARSAFAVGQARGVAMLAAARRGIPCDSYTPQQVKSAVCGHGGASKEQVGNMVQMLLALPAAPGASHASDALAVAVCHLNGAPLARALAGVTQ